MATFNEFLDMVRNHPWVINAGPKKSLVDVQMTPRTKREGVCVLLDVPENWDELMNDMTFNLNMIALAQINKQVPEGAICHSVSLSADCTQLTISVAIPVNNEQE